MADVFMMLLVTAAVPVWYIWSGRQISMTFQTSGRSICIKNDRLAGLLIAEKNLWGIATDPDKRNNMSLLGVISHMLLLPQLAFILYQWRVFVETGSGQWCEAAQTYLWTAMSYDIIALSLKLREAKKFQKGDIW